MGNGHGEPGSNLNIVFWPLTRPKMPFQGDAPEGRDTF